MDTLTFTLRKESSLRICVGDFEEISFKQDLTFSSVKLEIVYCKWYRSKNIDP